MFRGWLHCYRYPDRIEEREMFGFIEELQAAGLIPGALPRESPRKPR